MNKIYLFACESGNSGEGLLFTNFLTLLSANYKTCLYNDVIVKLLKSRSFLRDRILPFYFLLILAPVFLILRKNVILINYCPIWNPFIFLLNRFGLRIGPITGNYKIYTKNTFGRIKNLIIIFLANLSFFIMSKKNFYWISPPNVYIFLKNRNINCMQALPFYDLEIFAQKKLKKDRIYDIFIYTRYHISRNLDILRPVIKMLNSNYRIIQVGNGINSDNIYKSIKECTREEFDYYLGDSKIYLTASSEDAGYTKFKAQQLGLSIININSENFKLISSLIDNQINEEIDINLNCKNQYNMVRDQWIKNLNF